MHSDEPNQRNVNLDIIQENNSVINIYSDNPENSRELSLLIDSNVINNSDFSVGKVEVAGCRKCLDYESTILSVLSEKDKLVLESENLRIALEESHLERDRLVKLVESLKLEIESMNTRRREDIAHACVDTTDLKHESSQASSMTTPALCDWLLQTPNVNETNAEPDSPEENATLESVKANIFTATSDAQMEKECAVDENNPSIDAMPSSLANSVSPDLVTPQVWVEYTQEFVTPPYDMRSPVIAYLLSNWTADTNKAMYLVSWAECLGDALPLGFPMGLQVVGLNTEVRDGFLMLVIPIMRSFSKYPLKVYLRQSPSTNSHDSYEFDNWSNSSNSNMLYDIRVKLLAEPTRSNSTSSEATAVKWNPSDYGKNRVDSSSLHQDSRTTSRNNSVSDKPLSSLGSEVKTSVDESGSTSNIFGKPVLSSLTTSFMSIMPTSMIPASWAAKPNTISEAEPAAESATPTEGIRKLSVDSETGENSPKVPHASKSTSQLVYTSLLDISSSQNVQGNTSQNDNSSKPKVQHSGRGGNGQQRADVIAAKLAALRKQHQQQA